MAAAWETAVQEQAVLPGVLAAAIRGYRALLLGEPRDSQDWLRRELVSSHLAQAPPYRHFLATLLAQAQFDAGEIGQARRSLPAEGSLDSVRGLLALGAGDWEQAQSVISREQARAHDAGDRFTEWQMLSRLARVARARGDQGQTEAFLAEALALLAAGPRPLLELRVRPHLALLYAETGRTDAARTELARCRGLLTGSEDWRALTGDLALAEALLVWGRALVAAGERERGAAMYDAVLDIYRRIAAGARWREQVLELKGRLEPVRRDLLQENVAQEAPLPAGIDAAYPDGLTAREVEVLRLIAAGRTNKEVAAILVLGPGTVQRHTFNLYRKIRARGRADAAAYAFRHGLARPASR